MLPEIRFNTSGYYRKHNETCTALSSYDNRRWISVSSDHDMQGCDIYKGGLGSFLNVSVNVSYAEEMIMETTQSVLRGRVIFSADDGSSAEVYASVYDPDNAEVLLTIRTKGRYPRSCLAMNSSHRI